MKVLITAPYMIRERPKVEKWFEAYGLDITWADVVERLEEDQLLRSIADYDGIICGDDRITKKVLDKAQNLKVIVKWGTGIDSIDNEEAKNKRIPVFRTPNAFTDPVADTTLGIMLCFSRNININDQILKDGGWDKPVGFSLFEKTIGIIGFGDIGTAVAKRLYGFNTNILANDIVEKDPKIIKKYDVQMVSKDEIFERADFITLHCDLNETSFHILNEKAFALMNRSPVVVNTARGPLIHESALIEALKSKSVSGAGLDVFEDEPLPKDSPLRNMDNVLLAAHNANSSPACWDAVHQNSIKMLVTGLKIR